MIKHLFFTLIISLFSTYLYSANIFIYLNIENNLSQNFKIDIKKLSFYNNHNKIVTYKIDKIFTSKSDFNQEFVKKININEGVYNRVMITTEKGILNIPANIKINNETGSIYLVWDIRNSFTNGKFSPKITVKNQKVPLRGELLFVTSKEENALFFIRVDKNQVCSVMGINGSPVEFVLSCINDKLKILCENSKDIKIIEVSTFKRSDEFILPFVIEPDLLETADDYLIIGDSSNNRLITVNSANGAFENSVEVGENLSDIIYWSDEKKIIVASKNEQIIYILDKNLQILKSKKLNCSPDSLYLKDNFLFISETDCNTLVKLNLKNYSFEKRYRIVSPYKITIFKSTIFITNFFQKFISLIDEQQSFSSKKITLTFVPSRLAMCERRGWLYVSAKFSKKIGVIDLFGERATGVIDIGAKPYDLQVGRSLNKCY